MNMLYIILLLVYQLLSQNPSTPPAILSLVQTMINQNTPTSTVNNPQAAGQMPLVSQIQQAPPLNASDWSIYQPTNLVNVIRNPLFYKNSSIRIVGEVADFLPAGGRGGNTNYISVAPTDFSVNDLAMLEIDDSSDYQKAASSLGYYNLVRVWGSGSDTQNFTSNTGITNSLVIKVTRMDKIGGCDPMGCIETKDEPLFPSNVVSQNYNQNTTQSVNSNTTPTPTSTPTTINPTQTPIPTPNPSTTQCNFNGNVFSCTPDSRISASPTSLPNAVIGANYNQPITVNDPNTSSQNFRWNIIGGYLPPGIGLLFSPSQALECSGTYCFFTSPPSGLSYSSNNPAYFFGTPTATGTYSFTLQTIDALNYSSLSAFTMNIVSPATTSSSSPPTQAPTPTSTSTAPTSTSTPTTTNAVQCNFNGNVFNCTSNPNISATNSLSGAVLGVSYNQPITVNDPNTSSKNFRWNIIGGQLPPGISFSFSPSQALQCSGNYCFFGPPPNAGLSYSTNQGYFSGTPTAAGSYTFTLQVIDDANYVNVVTFTINVTNATSTQ